VIPAARNNNHGKIEFWVEENENDVFLMARKVGSEGVAPVARIQKEGLVLYDNFPEEWDIPTTADGCIVTMVGE
jgi:hypothetical protein